MLNLNAIPEKFHHLPLLALVLLIGLVLGVVPSAEKSFFAAVERMAFDAQMNLLRSYSPRSAKIDPVLVAFDEASIEAFPEPIALWHKHFAQVLDAIRAGEPQAVGVDVVLPTKSYEDIQAGLDFPYARSLMELRMKVPLVYVAYAPNGVPDKVHAPFFRALGEADGFASDQVVRDNDRVVRRFSEADMNLKPEFPSLAGRMTRQLKQPVDAGYIDFSIGEQVHYLPMHQVIAWLDAGNVAELKKQFAGRVVLLGSVLEDRDKLPIPVQLADWKVHGQRDSLEQPGVLTHLQILRSLLGEGMIHKLPLSLTLLGCLLASAMVFFRSHTYNFIIGIVLIPALLLGLSLLLLRQQILIPAATFVLLIWVALTVRGVADGVLSVLKNNQLKNLFAGSVSPAVMQEMLSGGLSAGVSSQVMEVCVVFSDVRGFTGLSESLTPEQVTALLTRYFDRMVEVVHRYGGTIDKFMGDGLMVLFGAPRALPDACGNAVKCAHYMQTEMVGLNVELARDGLPTLEIGVGVNYGKAVVGNIGSTQRNNYSAIGDAVNVASRIEGITKRLKTPIVIADSAAQRLGAGFDLIEFGNQAVRGHTDVVLWGLKSVPL